MMLEIISSKASEWPSFVYVMGLNSNHVRVQMDNYGYVQVNRRGVVGDDVRSYVYIDDYNRIRGLMDIDVWLLEGFLTNERASVETVRFLHWNSHYIRTRIAPEIDCYGNVVVR